MNLRHMVDDIGPRKDSRLVAALDVRRPRWSLEWIRAFVEESSNYIVGIKIGVPSILSFGLENISRVVNGFRDVIWIADMKLADIGYVGRLIVDEISNAGFDAIIMHGFVGFEKGVGDTIVYASDKGLSPILVAAMSHPGGEEYLNRVSGDILMKSIDYPVEGYILPATFTKYIRFYRKMVGERVILSPGVGTQGAKPGSAVLNGADLEIIGRWIYMDESPISRVRELHGVLRWHLQG